MRTHLHQAANYMALTEGESLDDRSMLDRRSEIADRYLKDAESHPWTPPCSFCGDSPTVAWFEGPDFTHWVDAASKVRAEEAWLACGICLGLVEANDREGLVERGVERLRRRDREEGRQRSPREEAWMLQMTRDQQEKQFWVSRQG